jgi:hypothetical protein
MIQDVPLATEADNEDIATKFEQGYVRCVRNEEECVCSVCVCSAPNCCDMEQRSASQPGSVASGTPCIWRTFQVILRVTKAEGYKQPGHNNKFQQLTAVDTKSI